MPRSVAELLPTIQAATASQDGLAPAALITAVRATFNPAAVDLSAKGAYDDYAEDGAIELALAGGTHFPGAEVTVRRTGTSVTVTVDGVTVLWADGDTGAKTWSDKQVLGLYYHPGLGVALAIVPGDGDSGGSGDMLAATYDPTGIAASAFARANHTGAQAISTVTDLQTELAAKQALLAVPSQAEAEAGTATTPRAWTAERVGQAIAALGAAGSFPTITAGGTTTLASTDAGDTVELSAAVAQQIIQLPTLSSLTAGAEINLICALDDTAFGAWPVLIEAQTPGQMQSQPQIAGWDTTIARVQMGLASSKGARVRALHTGNDWLVTGDFREPTLPLAPDQIADLEWWHDADQATLTLSTNDVTAWASKAGSKSGSFTKISTAAATQVGTPGTASYAVQFAFNAAAVFYEKPITAQAVDDFFLFIVVQSAAGTAETQIYRHQTDSSFSTQPHMNYGTVSDRIQAWSPVSHGLNFDGVGHASLPSAIAWVFDAPTSYAYLMRPTGVENRIAAVALDNTLLANSTHRIGNNGVVARTVKLFTIARFARVPNAQEIAGLNAWARARWGIA